MASSDNDKKITNILESPTKGVEESYGVLTRLWRVILKDRGIGLNLWTRLMTEYLNDPQNKIPTEGKKRSSDRNNLNKELARPNMTWNVFYKGLKLLGVVKFRLELTLEFRDKKRNSVHTLVNTIVRLPREDLSPHLQTDSFASTNRSPAVYTTSKTNNEDTNNDTQ